MENLAKIQPKHITPIVHDWSDGLCNKGREIVTPEYDYAVQLCLQRIS
jgi:hypothetical protein